MIPVPRVFRRNPAPAAPGLDLTKEQRTARASIQEAMKEVQLAADRERIASGKVPHRATELLETMEKVLSEAETAEGDYLEVLRCRAWDLAYLRSYFMSPESRDAELVGQASQLAEWHVPAEARARILHAIREVKGDKLSEADKRAVTEQLFDEYDYWSEYVDWYLVQRVISASVLLFLLIVGMFAAYFVLAMAHGVFTAFLLSASAGTAASILTRLPPVSVYGVVASFWVRMIVRYATGLAAGLVGLGGLALGLLSFGTGDGTSIASLIDRCAAGDDCSRRQAIGLLAVGFMLGFSERALSALGDALIPSDARASREREPTGKRDEAALHTPPIGQPSQPAEGNRLLRAGRADAELRAAMEGVRSRVAADFGAKDVSVVERVRPDGKGAPLQFQVARADKAPSAGETVEVPLPGGRTVAVPVVPAEKEKRGGK